VGVSSIERTDNIVLRINFLLPKSINRLIKANALRISQLENTSKSCALRCRQQHEERHLHFVIPTVYFCSNDRLGKYKEQKQHLRMSFHHTNPSGHYMYRTVVTICTTSLAFNSSTFCPHSVFMCFVWISEQTAIISLYSIN